MVGYVSQLPEYTGFLDRTLHLRSGFLVLSGAIYGLGRLQQLRKRNNLRRSLENCRDAGLNAGSAALLLIQTPALTRRGKKATVALSAAS